MVFLWFSYGFLVDDLYCKWPMHSEFLAAKKCRSRRALCPETCGCDNAPETVGFSLGFEREAGGLWSESKMQIM